MNNSTTNCRACGHAVSFAAKTCPHCGQPKPWLSKKAELHAALWAVGLTFLLFTIGPCSLLKKEAPKLTEYREQRDRQLQEEEQAKHANFETKKILLHRITMIHSQWQFIKEKVIDDGKLLIMAQNPSYPQLQPIWLLKGGNIYSINGAANALTGEFSYDITPLDAIDIIEGKKSFKNISVRKGGTWNTPQEAFDVLQMYEFITEEEVAIMRKLDDYLDNPINSDKKEAVEQWAKKNNISYKRLTEIDVMRFGYKSIENLRQDGYVRVGEKKQIKEIGQSTGVLIKKFNVVFKKTDTEVYIQVETDLPDGSPLMCSISKTGSKGDDKWIGKDTRATVINGKAEVSIPLIMYNGEPLEKGNYDIKIFFSSFWSAFHKDIDPTVKSKVGEFGENLQTPYNGIFEKKGKKYRTIDYREKAAFSVP